MSKIRNTSQFQRTGVLYPAAPYSRVLSVVIAFKVPQEEVYAVTPVVAQAVRLLGVTCFFAPAPPDVLKQNLFRIYTGLTVISTPNDMRDWQNILPLQLPGFFDEMWTYYDGTTEMWWNMNQLFTGSGRRFGVWGQAGTAVPRTMTVSFQISEG